jgi:polysaccharide deacetylase family sporulation protein PdaB
MFVYTVTKKRAIRTLLLALAVIVGIVIAITAIITSINTDADERRVPIYSVDRADNKIALTFNCAWGNSNTDELLAILARENIKSTFFVTGEFAEKYPEDVLKIFKAGHEIQSHSDKHPKIEGANINDIIMDTKAAERKISAITGVHPTLYRAPAGEYDNNSIITINGMGYKYIQWDVDSIDWQEPDARTIIRRVVNGTKSGSIILFHNDLANTTEALPEVVSRLKENGFSFTTVSDLIYHENYKIDHAGRQLFDGSRATSIHVPGTQINAAFEILLENLTIEEIMSLENGISSELALRLSRVLSREQIDAVTALSQEELQGAWATLVEAKITGVNPGNLELLEQNPDNLQSILDDYMGDKEASEKDVAGEQAVVTAPVTTPVTAPETTPDEDNQPPLLEQSKD